ncbi:hypothetical protein COMNV_01617 [Commensalibacter sp. Nvir]|uniref:rod shape-determining protein MreD n=1 Tax=Commensalibacter sp. Nvir TaxID=3069817 RepID=UPI002D2DC9EB|nr:hypothetical protein COMNV_01617 [Commensalibacter sp. Nvir]
MINDPNRQHISHKRKPGIRPTLNQFQKIDISVRSFVPWGTTVLIILFLSMPINIPGGNELLPAYVMCSVFFWSIFRPRSMPAFGVFILGVLIDLLNFSPPGVIIFILLSVYSIGITQRFRLAKYNFLSVWFCFSLVSVALFSLQWLLVSAFSIKLLSYHSVLLEIIFAVGFYPLLSIIFTWAHRTVANPEQV